MNYGIEKSTLILTSGRAFPDHLSPAKWIKWYNIYPIDNLDPLKSDHNLENAIMFVFDLLDDTYAFICIGTITTTPAVTFGHDAEVHHILQGAQRIGAELSLGECRGLPKLGCSRPTLNWSRTEPFQMPR